VPDKNARTKRSDREGTASTLTAVAKTDVREAFGAVHVEQWLTPFLDVVSYSSPQCPQMVRLWKLGMICDWVLCFTHITYHCIIVSLYHYRMSHRCSRGEGEFFTSRANWEVEGHKIAVTQCHLTEWKPAMPNVVLSCPRNLLSWHGSWVSDGLRPPNLQANVFGHCFSLANQHRHSTTTIKPKTIRSGKETNNIG
jgi:hypothetical protein